MDCVAKLRQCANSTSGYKSITDFAGAFNIYKEYLIEERTEEYLNYPLKLYYLQQQSMERARERVRTSIECCPCFRLCFMLLSDNIYDYHFQSVTVSVIEIM